MLSVESTDDPPLGSFVFHANGDSVVIGRDATKCGITVGTKVAGVSKLHIRLTLETEEVGAPFLRVEESNTYGTVFNGKRWKAPSVRAGDSFIVGKCPFVVTSLMDEDKTPPPEEEEPEEHDEEVEEEPRGEKRRLEDGNALNSTVKRRKEDDEDDEVIGSLWPDDDRFSVHPAAMAEEDMFEEMDTAPQKPEPPKEAPSRKLKTTRASQKASQKGKTQTKSMDIRHFLGESQKTTVSALGRTVLAPESVRGSQTQKSAIAARSTKKVHPVVDVDDDDFVEATPRRSERNRSQATSSSQRTVGSVLAPDSVRGSQMSIKSHLKPSERTRSMFEDEVVAATLRSQSLVTRDKSAPIVIDDDCENDDAVSSRSTTILAPNSPPPPSIVSVAETALTSVVPESIAPGAIGQFDNEGFAVPKLPLARSLHPRGNRASVVDGDDDAQSIRSTRILAPNSPPARSVISEAQSAVTCVVPESIHPRMDDTVAEAQPSRSAPKRKGTKTPPPPKRMKQEEPDEPVEPAASGTPMTLPETKFEEDEDALTLGLTEEQINAIHEKTVCVVSLCRAMSNQASLASPISTGSTTNYKRFHKAPQGVYHHLSLGERSFSSPTERTFVRVE
uniref:FHA domain-containing protein n=1 Tax=Steinernema glaseri TaxID=37863 RepID=A0A1I7XYW1_9BILA